MFSTFFSSFSTFTLRRLLYALAATVLVAVVTSLVVCVAQGLAFCVPTGTVRDRSIVYLSTLAAAGVWAMAFLGWSLRRMEKAFLAGSRIPGEDLEDDIPDGDDQCPDEGEDTDDGDEDEDEQLSFPWHDRTHPGETPREWRERTGHVPADPTTWNLDAPEASASGTFVDRPCGCRVVGNGTLPYPFTVLPCAAHRS